jgi:hypothetical protein
VVGIVFLMGGVVFVTVGSLVIKYRKSLRDLTADSEKAAFGRLGQVVGKLQTANGVGFTGGLAVCIGVLFLVNGIVKLVH